MEIIGFFIIPILIIAIAYLLYRAAGYPRRRVPSPSSLSPESIEREKQHLRHRLDELDRISPKERRISETPEVERK